MCDNRWFDETFGWTCPQLPICDLCYAISRKESRMEYEKEIDEFLSVLWRDMGRRYSLVQPEAPVFPPHSSVYELTLTTVEDDPAYLLQSLDKIVSSPIYGVVYFKACIELTEAGLPHIHAALFSSKKYIDASKIKCPKGVVKFKYRYECKKVRNLDKYLIYIAKESGNNNVVDYCKLKGVQQFYDGTKVL